MELKLYYLQQSRNDISLLIVPYGIETTVVSTCVTDEPLF